MEINYFGTALDCAGHYFWKLHGGQMEKAYISFSSLPFNPDDMPRRDKQYIRTKGEIEFYCENGFSIIAIEGSCADKRFGTKSVFFIKEVITKEEMIKRINSIPIARIIIDAMPFKVDIAMKPKGENTPYPEPDQERL
jgi:hypothetical protein